MPQCWDKVDVRSYLIDPQTGWINHTPYCDPNSSLLDCDTSRSCTREEAWSTCFLRLAFNSSAQNCETLDSGDCKLSELSKLTETLHPSILAQARYVVASIYGVAEFYAQYYNGKRALCLVVTDKYADCLLALNAMVESSLTIDGIALFLDPDKAATSLKMTVLTVLSASLSFLTVGL